MTHRVQSVRGELKTEVLSLLGLFDMAWLYIYVDICIHKTLVHSNLFVTCKETVDTAKCKHVTLDQMRMRSDEMQSKPVEVKLSPPFSLR